MPSHGTRPQVYVQVRFGIVKQFKTWFLRPKTKVRSWNLMFFINFTLPDGLGHNVTLSNFLCLTCRSWKRQRNWTSSWRCSTRTRRKILLNSPIDWMTSELRWNILCPPSVCIHRWNRSDECILWVWSSFKDQSPSWLASSERALWSHSSIFSSFISDQM